MPTQITEYSQTEAALQELRSKYQNIKFDVATTAGMNEAKKVRGELRTYRTDLEKRRVEIKAPALERCRLIDDEAKRITTELEALEKPIASQIKEEEDRVAAERQAKIDAENLRRTTIQGKIQKFRLVAGVMVNKTSAEIEETITKVIGAVVDEPTYNEFLADAEEARKQAVLSLQELLLKVQEAEAEQARIAAERAELEQLRAEREKMQKQIDEQNAAEQQRLTAEREAQEAEARQNKIFAERAAGVNDASISSWLKSTSREIEEEIYGREHMEFTEERFGKYVDDAIKTNNMVIEQLQQIRIQVTEREQQEATARVQQQERERLDREQAILEEQKHQAKERELAEAERTKKLLAAKKDTPVAALVEILSLCREGLKPEVALAHIEVIAEANITESVPKPKRIRGTK